MSFEDFLKEQGFHAEAVEFATNNLVATTPLDREICRHALSRADTRRVPPVRPEKKHLLP